MVSSIQSPDALASSEEETHTLKYQSDDTNHVPLPPSQPGTNHEPFKDQNGDDKDHLDNAVDPAVSSQTLNDPSLPLPNDRDNRVEDMRPPMVMNGGEAHQDHHDSNHDVATANDQVELHAPSAVNPKLLGSRLLLSSGSVSQNDTSVGEDSSSEKEVQRSEGSGRGVAEDDEIPINAEKFRPPTPPRNNSEKAIVVEPPPPLASIMRPSRPHSDAMSGGTLFDGHSGPTESDPKRKSKSVTFSDVLHLVPPLKIKSTMLPRTLLKRVERSLKTRRAIIAMQNDVDINRRKYNHDRYLFVNVTQEMQAYTQQLVGLVDGIPIDATIKATINECWTNFKSRASELMAQDRYLEQGDKSLEIVEATALAINTDLLERETKLFESYDQFDVPERNHPADNIGDDDDGTLSARSASSWEDPTVLAYYDKIGDVSLAMDHLHNLDTDHLSNLYAWESQRQRGIQVTQEDLDKIYSSYFKEREDMIAHYLRCKQETDLFYGLCMDRRLEVEPPNLPPENFTTLDSSLRRSGWKLPAIDATSMEGGGGELQALEIEPSPKRSIPNPMKFSKEKVWIWIRQMEGYDMPRNPGDDSTANTNWEPESRYISEIVDGVNVQVYRPPETIASIDTISEIGRAIPETGRSLRDNFPDGKRSQRRDSDPILTGDAIAARQAVRDEYSRRPRSSSVSVALGARAEHHDDSELDQFTVAEPFQRDALKNILLYLWYPTRNEQMTHVPHHTDLATTLVDGMMDPHDPVDKLGPDTSRLDPARKLLPPPVPPTPPGFPPGRARVVPPGPQGPPPGPPPQGPPPVVTQDKPLAMPQGEPSAIPQGPPSVMTQDKPLAIPQGEPSTIPQGPPPIMTQDKPLAMPQGEPSAMPQVTPSAVPEGESSAMPSGRPSGMPPGPPPPPPPRPPRFREGTPTRSQGPPPGPPPPPPPRSSERPPTKPPGPPPVTPTRSSPTLPFKHPPPPPHPSIPLGHAHAAPPPPPPPPGATSGVSQKSPMSLSEPPDRSTDPSDDDQSPSPATLAT